MNDVTRYADMKDSGVEWIGKIPSHWKMVANKYIMYKKKTICERWNGEDILSLTMKGVVIRDVVNPSGKMPLTFDGYQYIYKGDLLMCLFDIDVTPRCIGRVYNDGVTSPAYSRYIVFNKYSFNFLYYYYLMLDNSKILVHLSKNLRHSFTDDQLKILKIPMPSSKEQSNIASYLDDQCAKIDDIIAGARTSIDEYRKWKASVIYEAVTKGLDPHAEMKDSGVEWIGKIPSHWETIKVKYLFRINKNIAGKEGYTVLSVTQKGITPKNMKEKGQFAMDYSGYQIVHCGDFIMNHMDLLTGWIDISSYNGVTSPDYRVFYINKNTEFSLFYKYVFQSCYTNKIFYNMGQGVSGLGRWRLPTEIFYNFIIPVPKFEEQKDIVNYLDRYCSEIDQLISEKEALIADLESYKKSLIYEVVTGKRKVS